MINAEHTTAMVAGKAGRIAVVDHGGHGPDVVLLHGANRSLLDWEAVRPSLGNFRLIAFDLRGHGCSDPPADGDYGWDAHLADLNAAQVQDLIGNIRVAATAQGWNPDLEEANARRCLISLANGMYARRPAPHALPALISPLDGWDMFAELRQLTCPALVVQGGQHPDLNYLPADIRELTESLIVGITREIDALRREAGSVQAVRIDNAAHMVHLDAPGTIGCLIRDFISDKDQTVTLA